MYTTSRLHILTLIAAVLIAAMVAAPTAFAQSAAFHANGDFAGVSYCGNDFCLFLYPSRGQSNGQTSTFLYYQLSTYTATTETDRVGYGQIPNSNFTVKGNTDALSVDTSAVSGFSNFVCTFNFVTGEGSCDTANGGPVAALFTAMPKFYSYRSSGSSSYKFPGGAFTTTGTSSSSFANANVSVFGLTLTNIAASVGQNNNTYISIQKNY